LWVYFIILTVFFSFHLVLGNGFVWDDEINLVNNNSYRGFSIEHLSWMFRTFHDANYHPLVWLSYGVDHFIWGMSPAGYHLTNLILHILNSVLFFYFLKILIENSMLMEKYKTHMAYNPLFLTTGVLFFAIHPLRVENVAWLSARADLMCATFLILTTMFYLKYAGSTSNTKLLYFSALSFYILSLLSRAWGITLPALLLVIDIFPLRRLSLKNLNNKSTAIIIIEKFPFIILAMDASILAFVAKYQRSLMPTLYEHDIRRLGFEGFHKLFSFLTDYPIPSQTGIFGLLDKQVVTELKNFNEKNRFFPGLRSWVGFKQVTVHYHRDNRSLGKPKQNLKRLVRYAFDAIFSFSYKPLRIMTGFGMVVSICGFILATLFVIKRLIGFEVAQTGFTTLISVILFLGGIQIISVGLLGEYLARVFDEVRQRPLFIVKKYHFPGRLNKTK